MSQICIIILTIGLLMVSVSAQYNQQATLYSGLGSQGSFTNLIEAYYPDLHVVNFDNLAYSTCLNGIWLFYDELNFNPSNALMEYAFGPSNFCTDFNNLAGKASSARFAGSAKDYRTDTLTLFEGTYFQGQEEYTYVDLPNLNLDQVAASLIVTGASPWTVYDGPNFSGNAVCVYPPQSNDFSPALVYDTVNISIPHKAIRSVRKGCWGKRKVFAEDLPKGGLVNLADQVDEVAPVI